MERFRKKVDEGDHDSFAHIEAEFSLSVFYFFLVFVQVNDEWNETISRDSLPYSHVPFDELKHFDD